MNTKFHKKQQSQILDISSVVVKYRRKNKCGKKIQYKTRHEAEIALHEYLSRVLLSNMNVYRCENHESFHLGHNRFMSTNKIIHRDKVLAVSY